jgi:hypothetical protein
MNKLSGTRSMIQRAIGVKEKEGRRSRDKRTSRHPLYIAVGSEGVTGRWSKLVTVGEHGDLEPPI